MCIKPHRDCLSIGSMQCSAAVRLPAVWPICCASHYVDSEHGCVTSTDSSRDFCQLSAKSVDSQFIWCRKMPPHWLHFNNEHMVTWVSPPHLTVRTQVCVCVCLLTWAVHSFVHDGESTWPCACVGAATCHSRCCSEPRQRLWSCTIHWPSETVEDSASSLIKDGAPLWQIMRLLPYSKMPCPV